MIESRSEKYYGSAIGALEECLRICIQQRHGNVYFYLGQLYYEQDQIGKVYSHYIKAKEILDIGETDKHEIIDDFLDQHALLNDTIYVI